MIFSEANLRAAAILHANGLSGLKLLRHPLKAWRLAKRVALLPDREAMTDAGGLVYGTEVDLNDTHRTVEQYIIDLGKERKTRKPKVLDLAGGTGIWAECAARAGADVVLVDFGNQKRIRENIEKINKNLGREAIRFIPADIRSIGKQKLREINPDIVTCNYAIHFISPSDTEALIKNVAIPLAQDGILMLAFNGLVRRPNTVLDDKARRKNIFQASREVSEENESPKHYCYDPDEVRFLMHTLGFEVLEEGYGQKLVKSVDNEVSCVLLFRKRRKPERNHAPWVQPETMPTVG